MDRRLVLLGMTTGMVAGPTLVRPALAAMSEAERKHAQDTAMAGMAALKMADIGLKKASNGMVKQFAQFEHDEQTTIAEILKSMDSNMTPPKPDEKTAGMIEKLQEMKAGAEFDRMFVEAQTDGHRKLLSIQEAYLSSGKDRDTINLTKLARGMIKEHLILLDNLKRAA